MKIRLLLIPLIVICIGCAKDSNGLEAYEDATVKVEVAEGQNNASKTNSNLENPSDVIEGLATIKQQVENGDYSQVEDFISQLQTYSLKESTQMTAEEGLSFPQLTQGNLVDFFKSVDVNSLRANGSFDKKYSFGSAPEGYEPDSEECPDLLILFVENNSSEVSLMLRNSFLVNDDIGCAESATIYLFTVENGALGLKKVDYAG